MVNSPPSILTYRDLVSDTGKIKTRCPHCQTQMKVSAKYVGRVAKCPVDGCGEKFNVEPLPAPPPALPPAPSAVSNLEEDNPFLDTPPPPPPPPTGLTVASGTYASNPGKLKVNPVRWILHKPTWPLVWGLLLVASVALVSLSPGFLTGFGLLLAGAMNFFYWRRVGDHFRYGCANPGIVVSLKPTLVAVHTDLTMGQGEYPVIKIVEVKLRKSAGEPLEVGGLLPTVALYSHPANDNDPHWSDFDPLPADYVTGDVAKVLIVLATFTREDVDQLKEGLAHIAQPYQPGLYVLWPEPGEKIGRLADFETDG